MVSGLHEERSFPEVAGRSGTALAFDGLGDAFIGRSHLSPPA
jgi:hypothetical protein